MKKIVYAVLATISGLVLLFSYRTSHLDTTEPLDSASSTTSPATSSAGDGAASASPDAGAASPGAASDSSSAGFADGTYTGAPTNTRFGAVQVQITVAGGMITAVEVPEYPSSNPRDRQINERALPLLISETTAAQSADIDMVSGATYTSEGYLESLQSAIDLARG